MTRYAVYFVPPPQSPLAGFGAHAIGYDVETGKHVPHHDHPLFHRAESPAWSGAPARYGFHATLKAPFELAPARSETDLDAAVGRLAANLSPASIGRLEVTELGNFLALTPAGCTAAVDRLAAACVEQLDPLRAPLSAADRARRLEARLTSPQVANVERWGYPYVFGEFRFHMTLTGRIADPDLRAEVKTALGELYRPIDEPRVVAALTVCRQPARDQPFTVHSRHRLSAKS